MPDYTYSLNDPIKSGHLTPTRPLDKVTIQHTKRKLLVSLENSVEEKRVRQNRWMGLEIMEVMEKEQESG
jgi:hypothetical protein